MTIRVLLADDQNLVRAAFAMLVESARDMEVVGQAATGREAVELARSERADLIVMDIRMPDLDGIEATRLIAADESLAGVRVLVLTTYDTDEHIVDALRAGASGFLVKDTRPAELLDAIRTVAAGDALLSPGPTARLVARFLRAPRFPRSWWAAPRASPSASARCSPWSRADSTTPRSRRRSGSVRSRPRPTSAASWGSWAPATGPSWSSWRTSRAW